VLLNLTSNAVKSNRHGGSISLTCHAGEDGRIRIAITDTGPGIPADKLPRLFTQFDRLGADTPRSKAPAWAWCWPSGWRRRWAAPSPSTASRAREPTFTLELSPAMEPA
jgi:Histidine kinase-, DNA gyrase B-, and HSP90-like ATPase